VFLAAAGLALVAAVASALRGGRYVHADEVTPVVEDGAVTETPAPPVAAEPEHSTGLTGAPSTNGSAPAGAATGPAAGPAAGSAAGSANGSATGFAAGSAAGSAAGPADRSANGSAAADGAGGAQRSDDASVSARLAP
jgi:hypothetical protein